MNTQGCPFHTQSSSDNIQQLPHLTELQHSFPSCVNVKVFWRSNGEKIPLCINFIVLMSFWNWDFINKYIIYYLLLFL